MVTLTNSQEQKLIALLNHLVDQNQARVLVPPLQSADGFWFGGGDLFTIGNDSYVCGRYRNAGDSRTGVGAGARGAQFSIFRLGENGEATEVRKFSKDDLAPTGSSVLSIEGASIAVAEDGIRFFVSTEKANLTYPHPFEEFQKPGTGVWTIEENKADSLDSLGATGFKTILSSSDPQRLHLKDPHSFVGLDGRLKMIFCTHPFLWTSSNSSLAELGPRSVESTHHEVLNRGLAWDVAMTRITGSFLVPQIGEFRSLLPVRILFYDGGESVRNYEEHQSAIKRPRGYSCEELGGAAYCINDDFRDIHRLSRHLPLFVSPWGTGSSRYAKAMVDADGITAVWEQSQEDRSQPLVTHRIDTSTVERCLS